jgi:hypothetical protein
MTRLERVAQFSKELRGNSGLVPSKFNSTQVGVEQMAHVVSSLDQPSNYKDSQTRVDRMKQNEMLSKSTTLYVRQSPWVHQLQQ